MMRFSMISALVALTALLASPAAVVSQQQNWTFCSIIQAGTFYSTISAIITSNQSTPLLLGGMQGGYLAINAVGTRSYYDLTSSSSPTKLQTANIVSLDGTGSIGGNDNLFWPNTTQLLDWDGLTFHLDQIPLINGFINNPAATQSLNFWWYQDQLDYDEENVGVTHETEAWGSSLAIASTTTNTMPTCSPLSTVQFYFCLAIAGATYQTAFTGILTTTGLAKPISATSSNQLLGTQQGVTVVGASGTRTYTDFTTGAVSVLGVTGVATSGTFASNTNLLYPAYPQPTDLNGIALQMNGTVTVFGEGASSNSVLFWYQNSLGNYIEMSSAGAPEETPLYSSFVVSAYKGGAVPACVVPGPPLYYSFCVQLVSPTFTTVFSGMLTLQNIPSVANNQIRYLIVAATGIRTFTDSTGQATTNNIVSVAPVGALGSNSNFLYINSPNWLDSAGVAFTFDGNPPISGQPLGGTTLNLNFGGIQGRYFESTSSGTQESTPAVSSMVVQPASIGSAVPTCTLPTRNLASNLRQWSLCGTIQYSSYTSAIAAVLTTNSTQVTYNGKPAYFAVNAVGSRTYTNLTTSAMAQQNTYIQYLDAPGSTGGNSNYVFPTLTPLLDGDGLTFHMNVAPLIAGQSMSGATVSMNYWYSSSVLSYLEENNNGQHESTPFQSTLTIVPYTSSLGAGPMCNLPTTINFNFCFVLVGTTFTTLFSGVITTNGIATAIAPDGFNQLPGTQQGYTVVAATGSRAYTNISTGVVSTTNVIGIIPIYGFLENGNTVYPGYSRATDWNGISFMMDGLVLIAGEPNAADNVVIWYQQAVSQYLEETKLSTHESTPNFSSFTLLPATGVGQACVIPSSAQPLLYYSFCSNLGINGQFSAVMTGVLTLTANAFTVNGQNAYRVIAANGTRTYTDSTGTVTTNTIVSLAPVGNVGGNTNFLFIGSNPVLDFDGITFTFDSIPPIYKEPTGSVNMNWWFNSATNSYLEETVTHTYEGTPSYNFTTIAPYTGTPMACGNSNSNPSGSNPSGSSSSSSSSLSGGAIAGIVIGVVVGAAIILTICLVLFCGLCKPKGSKLQETNSGRSGESEASRVEHNTDVEMQ